LLSGTFERITRVVLERLSAENRINDDDEDDATEREETGNDVGVFLWKTRKMSFIYTTSRKRGKGIYTDKSSTSRKRTHRQENWRSTVEEQQHKSSLGVQSLYSSASSCSAFFVYRR
jgi:hypothetical protein